MLTSFDHVTVLVHELSAALARYASLLGAQPTWRGKHHDLGTEAAIFGLGNGLLELVAPLSDDACADGLRAHLESHGEGLHAIAFGTEDAQAARAWLRERGVLAAPVVEGTAQSADDSDRHYGVIELSRRQARGLNVLVVERPDRSELVAVREPSRAAPEAVDHVVIVTAEPQAAVRYYGEQLGLRLALDHEIRGNRMLFFRIGGVTVEVVEDQVQVPPAPDDRFFGVAYRVADIEAAHARLSAEGFAISEPRAGNKSGTRVLTVRDGTCSVPTLMIEDPSRRPR